MALAPVLCCFFLVCSTLLTRALRLTGHLLMLWWKVRRSVWAEWSFCVCTRCLRQLSTQLKSLRFTDQWRWQIHKMNIYWICVWRRSESLYRRSVFHLEWPSRRSLDLDEFTILAWFGVFTFCYWGILFVLFCLLSFVFYFYFVPTFSFIVHH